MKTQKSSTEHTDAEAKLIKLGQLLRRGFEKKYPVSERSLETARKAIQEQWEEEQEAKRQKATTP